MTLDGLCDVRSSRIGTVRLHLSDDVPHESGIATRVSSGVCVQTVDRLITRCKADHLNLVFLHVARDLSKRTHNFNGTAPLPGKRAHREGGGDAVFEFEIHHLMIDNVVVAMVHTAPVWTGAKRLSHRIIRIFQTHDLVIGYDEPLSKPLNFTMERGQKIALVGTNGIGKTTLLRSLLGLIKPLSGSVEQGENLEIGYFEQEVKGENRTTCIEELWQEFPSFSQYEVRSALAKCGLTTKHIESQVRVLSGGEQAKVRLCKLVNRDTNILLLDEPTNHLDVDAKDELKKALREYRGSILLICHEPEFYQDVVNEVWDMSRWTTKIF